MKDKITKVKSDCDFTALKKLKLCICKIMEALTNTVSKLISCVKWKKPESHNLKKQLKSQDSIPYPYGNNIIIKRHLLSETRELTSDICKRSEFGKPIMWYFSGCEQEELNNSSNRVKLIVQNSGRDLFERAFKYDKAFKQNVKEKRNYSDERIESLFNTHSERLLWILSELIEHVNDVKHVFEKLEILSSKHSAFGVEELHMDLMLGNFLDVVQRFDWEYWSSQLEKVWIKFLRIILSIIIFDMRNKQIE
ncbi:hypothetical protein GJ496_008608 [Pomphorhynchus laevis]|nr:hypothetical protein GJ496_008608 [Pomphorhynchus laevis]